MEETRASERRERKDVRRNMERVLAAAHALFAERGAAVTMEEVARHAGVGVGTVYRRFPSKEHLFAAVSHAVCADAHHCLKQAVETEPDPVTKLRALVVIHYHRTTRQAALLDLHQTPTEEGKRCVPTEQQQLYAGVHHLLQHVIAEGQRQGLIRDGDPAMLAALCLELLHPRALQNLRRFCQSDDEAAEHVVHFMLSGLRK
jgi:AcrR family transcriptional regulator